MFYCRKYHDALVISFCGYFVLVLVLKNYCVISFRFIASVGYCNCLVVPDLEDVLSLMVTDTFALGLPSASLTVTVV